MLRYRHHDKLKEYGFEFMEIRLVVYNLIQKYFSLFISDTIFFSCTPNQAQQQYLYIGTGNKEGEQIIEALNDCAHLTIIPMV